jgi:uroporphyrinogen decarboxylase
MEQVKALKPLDDPTKDLDFIQETLSGLRYEIDKQTTLLGFVGSPWTLAAYAVEGKAERHCLNTKARPAQHAGNSPATQSTQRSASGSVRCIACGQQLP